LPIVNVGRAKCAFGDFQNVLKLLQLRNISEPY